MTTSLSISRRRFAICSAAVLVGVLIAGPAAARPGAEGPSPLRAGGLIAGRPVTGVKAAVDTVLLMGPQGSGAPYLGTFEDGAGSSAWNGWTSVDFSVATPNAWHVDTYNVVNGAYSAWCGEARFPSCGPGDPEGGYGNNYDAVLEWRGVVTDPGQPCTLTVSAVVNLDSEPGYDYASLLAGTSGGDLELWSRDGQETDHVIGGTHVYQPGDYLGQAGDEVVVRFRVTSDGGWSDEDCNWPTGGAIQLDDVVVTLDNGTGMSHDFEDGTLGPLVLAEPPFVGDFAQLWTGLEGYDPCATNYSPQAAFIDDGVVVPGTGGAPCLNWCYGPNGWIVNTTGGVQSPDHHINNAVLSPVMPWPDPALDGARLSFDVFEHEDLGADAPGMFWVWYVRSAPGSDPADLANQPWVNDNFVYYGGPGYERRSYDVRELLAADRGQVQIRLGVWELGWVWGWNGDDGYPAPYFDNVRFAVYDALGPHLTAYDRDLAQDAFIEAGVFDPAEPGAANVRFDMARSVSTDGTALIAGDSLVVTARALGDGAQLDGPPRLHYRLRRNPVFDPWRTSGLPDQGQVPCGPAPGYADRFVADLPDSGFLFPGDVLHYYFAATESGPGTAGTALLPADTTGFASFAFPPHYDRRFTVRALPSLDWYGSDPANHYQPPVLVWFDGQDDQQAWERWLFVLAQLCLEPGFEADVFTTQAANRGDGNGLGARATVEILAGYDAIVYTSGALRYNTLGAGDPYFGDPSPDVQLLEVWLQLGERGLVLGGDGLASDLTTTGAGTDFLRIWCGAAVVQDDIAPYIGGQVSPVVLAIPGSGLYWRADSWRLEGGCPAPRSFDVVTTVGAGVRFAEYATPWGAGGAYPYAAACGARTTVGAGESRTLLMPWDLTTVGRDPAGQADSFRHTATNVLWDALVWSGYSPPYWCVSGVEPPSPREPLAVTARPNPFNPRVRIAYTVPHPGHLTVSVYDLRGRLVRVLLDERVETSGRLDWDGIAADGRAAASGVYFCEARMDNERQVQKLALIR